jgi:flagellin-like hook-associated protein FlgL
LASGTTSSTIATALAVPLATQASSLNVAQQNVAIAGNVLSSAQQALTSVGNTLTQALATASEALSAPVATQAILARQFNALMQQTSGLVDNAQVGGQNLVAAGSTPMTVNTTGEGGQITVANAPSDAASLGVGAAASEGWGSAAAINASIDQVQSALNQITSTQASFAAAQNVLQVASQVNQSSLLAAAQSQAAVSGSDVAATAAASSTAQVQSVLAVAASAQQDKLAKSVVKLLKD